MCHSMKHNLGRTIFSETTLYTKNLFHLFQKRPCQKATPGRKAKQNKILSHINFESAGNLRPNTPTGYEPKVLAPKELTTISGSSLEDIHQFYDVKREFGEQDQQAPDSEELKEFGQIQAQSSLDHEMQRCPLSRKCRYLQSQMHFDESMESTADSDLEDGELQKLLTSQLYAQRALGKPDAMVVQEREVSAPTSPSS